MTQELSIYFQGDKVDIHMRHGTYNTLSGRFHEATERGVVLMRLDPEGADTSKFIFVPWDAIQAIVAPFDEGETST